MAVCLGEGGRCLPRGVFASGPKGVGGCLPLVPGVCLPGGCPPLVSGWCLPLVPGVCLPSGLPLVLGGCLPLILGGCLPWGKSASGPRCVSTWGVSTSSPGLVFASGPGGFVCPVGYLWSWGVGGCLPLVPGMCLPGGCPPLVLGWYLPLVLGGVSAQWATSGPGGCLCGGKSASSSRGCLSWRCLPLVLGGCLPSGPVECIPARTGADTARPREQND